LKSLTQQESEKEEKLVVNFTITILVDFLNHLLNLQANKMENRAKHSKENLFSCEIPAEL
jgi:hypothetical protein